MNRLFIYLLGILTPLSLFSISNQSPIANFEPLTDNKNQLIVNNRILAEISNHPISTIDLCKTLSMIFEAEYPEFKDNLQARYEFYTSSWLNVLKEEINKILVIQDAKSIDYTPSESEIRQYLEQQYGPNLLKNLQTKNLSYAKAWDKTKIDLIMGRMILIRVNVRTMNKIRPEDVKKAYTMQLNQHQSKGSILDYTIIAIQCEDQEKQTQVAQEFHQCLVNKKNSVEEAKQSLQTRCETDPKVAIYVSKNIQQQEHKISSNYKKILTQLEVDHISQPTEQYSRKDNKKILRLFMLHSKETKPFPSIDILHETLKQELMNKLLAEETHKYLKRLKKRFNINTADILKQIPSNYNPFQIQVKKTS